MTKRVLEGDFEFFFWRTADLADFSTELNSLNTTLESWPRETRDAIKERDWITYYLVEEQMRRKRNATPFAIPRLQGVKWHEE